MILTSWTNIVLCLKSETKMLMRMKLEANDEIEIGPVYFRETDFGKKGCNLIDIGQGYCQESGSIWSHCCHESDIGCRRTKCCWRSCSVSWKVPQRASRGEEICACSWRNCVPWVIRMHLRARKFSTRWLLLLFRRTLILKEFKWVFSGFGDEEFFFTKKAFKGHFRRVFSGFQKKC